MSGILLTNKWPSRVTRPLGSCFHFFLRFLVKTSLTVRWAKRVCKAIKAVFPQHYVWVWRFVGDKVNSIFRNLDLDNLPSTSMPWSFRRYRYLILTITISYNTMLNPMDPCKIQANNVDRRRISNDFMECTWCPDSTCSTDVICMYMTYSLYISYMIM